MTKAGGRNSGRHGRWACGRGGGGLDQGVNSVRKGLDFVDSLTILSLEADLAIKRPDAFYARISRE